jgi:hypothetical protein
MFIEKVEDTKSLLVHAKDKCSLDLEGKELLIFLLQQPMSYRKEQGDIQTDCLPEFQYVFNPSKPKAMGLGPDYFPQQRIANSEQDTILVKGDCICSLCKQCVLVSDEFIRLLDCNHIYHRICMIHNVASVTNKRFFLTRNEQQNYKDQPLSLCPNCK